MRAKTRPASVVGLLLLMGCGRPPGERGESRAAEDASAPSWQLVFAELPGALLSVWGENRNDVWAAGSEAEDGTGALVFRFDGTAWTRVVTGVRRDLWWVHGFPEGPVFLAGTRGTVVRHAGGSFRVLATPRTEATVFGVWGASPDDLWAVGGDLGAGRGAFVWRFDGAAWRALDVPGPAGDGALFKVWGTAADDVWIVGTSGAILHFDGTELFLADAGIGEPLFTVHGAPGESPIAVGGFDVGVALDLLPSGTRASGIPPGTPQLFGVWTDGGVTRAVGAEGTVLERTVGRWREVDTALDLGSTFHATWGDETGAAWAVGGHVATAPLGAGVLVQSGPVVSTAVRTRYALAQPDPVPGYGSIDEIDAAVDEVDGSPSPGVVACGGASCALGGARCCVDPRNAAASCVATGLPCPDGSRVLACDDAADCETGSSCCVLRALQGGAVTAVDCSGSCAGEQACAGPADCAGRVCDRDGLILGLATCR